MMAAGSLFSGEFLAEGVRELAAWKAARGDLASGLAAKLRRLRAEFPAPSASEQRVSEQVTADELVWRVLGALGWTETLREQNLSLHGRRDIPDGLLFLNAAEKTQALRVEDEFRRFAFGVCLVETKRWKLDLDRPSGSDRAAPATQMLRYLRRARTATGGRVRWGILTNGARWRLYHTEARSVSGDFFEVELDRALDPTGSAPDRFPLEGGEPLDELTLFTLFFRRDGFLPEGGGGETVHDLALEQGRYFAEKVAGDLSKVVFGEVFGGLAARIAGAAPDAPLPEVQEAALVLLYRLLFILYAEDRGLLPVGDSRYRNIGLRHQVRGDIAERLDRGEAFSEQASGYWHQITDLCRVLDSGDPAFGLPPYNGGLFDRSRAPLLDRIALSDAAVARVVDRLGFREAPGGRRYLNYRDLSVSQLGSIYERLLEQEVVHEKAGEAGKEDEGGVARRVVVRPNSAARRDSGSYYTPEPLVRLVIEETVSPRVEKALHEFAECAGPEADPAELAAADAASRILALKVLDPAMGSGHFLVSLLDYLTDGVIEALALTHEQAPGYESPVAARIREIRQTILENARAGGWTVEPSQLDDRQLVRRMVLKRSIYGVDKNPMAVELAKLSLWLHSFTVGAPLSFLDHHLRSGDSLFGSWVREGKARALAEGGPLFVAGPIRRAAAAASPMAAIERLSDAELSEVSESERLFDEIQERTRPFAAFLSVLHALDWLEDRSREARAAVKAYLGGRFGDPVALAAEAAAGEIEVPGEGALAAKFRGLLDEARRLAAEESFLSWELAFPGVFAEPDAESPERGGFDAVIGNPPWDRVKLQQVEWFALRRPEIAGAQRASDRKAKIAALGKSGDPLAADFARADRRARAAARVARESGDYPLLGRGDLNLYSLFVERGMALLHPEGVLGLLVPSGIAADKTAAPFFRSLTSAGKLRALYDFENRRTRFGAPPFFPAVDSRFKFCVLAAGRSPTNAPARCAFFLQSISELGDPERVLELSPEDFRRVNPNTGTAPIFRSRRDQEITTAIYRRLPVLVDRSAGEAVRAWPVKYVRMFDMTNDSRRFRTRAELEEKEGAWRVRGNLFDSPSGAFVPLYEGKMVQAFDHRAARVAVNPENRHRPGVPVPAALEQHRDPDWSPEPQFWIPEADCGWQPETGWVLGFKEITATTNIRTVIAALLPAVGFGNKIPVLCPLFTERREWLLAANLNSIPLDFVARQKVQGQTLNLFLLEQLPVVPPEAYEAVRFGPKTAFEIVREAVLELSYTANDLASFAEQLGYLDASGRVRPPFVWNEDRRLRLRAKIDAVFFHLYGVSDRDEVRHIYSTFPLLERQEQQTFGSYRSRDLALAWGNALAAGRPDAEPEG